MDCKTRFISVNNTAGSFEDVWDTLNAPVTMSIGVEEGVAVLVVPLSPAAASAAASGCVGTRRLVCEPEEASVETPLLLPTRADTGCC